MTATVLLLVEISTAMPKYSIHTSTLTDMAPIEGKIYPRKSYVSNEPSDQKREYSHVLFRTTEGCGESEEYKGIHYAVLAA